MWEERSFKVSMKVTVSAKYSEPVLKLFTQGMEVYPSKPSIREAEAGGL